jgi:hypothetical protein
MNCQIQMIVRSAGLLAAVSVSALVHAETVNTRIGELSFDRGMPTKGTVAKLYDEMDFQRAVQAYLCAVPMVGMEESKQAHEQNSGARNGDIVIYEGYRNVSVFLTTNVTTPYIVAAVNLAEHGPMVVDYPAGATAGVMDDWWDRPVTDVGVPGPDRGQGGKYLFVGPGQDAPAAEGYRVVRSRTVNNLFFYRVLEPDPAKAEALKKAVRIYPYSQRDNPPSTRILTPKQEGELRIGVQPKGLAYWERVSQAVNEEPVEDRDRFFMAMLKPLGIEKGKPFQPDERQRKILAEAAFVGEAMAKASAFDKRFDGIRYRPDANWEYVVAPSYAVDQDIQNSTQFEERTALFYEAVGMSAASITQRPGVGQTYLGAYHDKNGNAFDGSKTYRLRVPPNPPVNLFWSITLYEAETRVLIQNKQQIADRSSRLDMVRNADGSVDIYFGPTAPTGFEKNWIPTVPGRAWFTYLRLYGPLEAYFDKTWPLPDIEQQPG